LAKTKVRKRENLSKEAVMSRVLAFLCNKGEIGALVNHIRNKADITSQDSTNLKEYCDELCEKGLLEKYEQETGGTKIEKRIYYRITGKGRERLPVILEFFGVELKIES
jgi:DNA-binding MarR family transcriptional regulator